MKAPASRPSSRRDRARAATRAEILQTARKVLLSEGSGAISLRAIAREMGMTAPAIYRYFGSHEELLQHVVADLFNELTDHILEATSAAAADPGLADGEPWLKPALRLLAACRAFRGWALDHRPEFALIFASPLPGLSQADLSPDDIAMVCGMRFGGTFFDLFAQLYVARPFPIPPGDEIDPAMRSQLTAFGELSKFNNTELPLGALLVFLRAWVTFYGSVCLEVFDQLRFALEDASPMFELVIADLAAMVGISLPLS